MTDGEVANEIFTSYGFTPRRRATPTTTRRPARPTGTRCSSAPPTCSSCAAWRAATASSAGSRAPTRPGERTGYFVTPDRRRRSRSPRSTLVDPDAWTVDCLEFDWDVMRPTEVDAQPGRRSTRLRRRRRRQTPPPAGSHRWTRATCPTYAGPGRRRHAAAHGHGRRRRAAACAPPPCCARPAGSSAAAARPTSTGSARRCAPAPSWRSTAPGASTRATGSCGACDTRSRIDAVKLRFTLRAQRDRARPRPAGWPRARFGRRRC